MSNPLLHFAGLPKFNEIKPEHVSPALNSLLAEGRALIELLANSKENPTWQNFLTPTLVLPTLMLVITTVLTVISGCRLFKTDVSL